MTVPYIVQPGDGPLLDLGNFEAVVLFVYVPANVVHTFVVVSEEPGKKLNLFSPAAMVGFFEELAELESRGMATPERLAEISARNNMEIVGPVPQSYL